MIYPLSAAASLGVEIRPTGLLASTTRMPTVAEETAAKVAALEVSDAWLMIERGFVAGDYDLALLVLVAAVGLVTLGGTFAAVGLAAAESRADISTLTAVGASPRVRRRLAAGQAGVIAGLGTALGMVGGVFAGWILVRLQDIQQSPVVWISGRSEALAPRWDLALPWTHLLVLGIGLPLLAIAIGFLTSRSRLPLVRRLGQ